jgi:hypothetical protein
MSNCNYWIFFRRPIALTLLAISIGLLLLSAVTFVLRRNDWRSKLSEVSDH